MNIFMKCTRFRFSTAAALALVLLAGTAILGYAAQGQRQIQVLADSDAAAIIGGMRAGGCGIVVGIGLGILALGASAATVGIGGAMVLSVGLHVGAAICFS